MLDFSEITTTADIINRISPREAIWKCKPIKYRPGRLNICLDRRVAHRDAYNLLVKNGCQIEYNSFNDGLFEVLVEPQKTLHIAVELSKSNLFRYVEPDIITDNIDYYKG